MKTALSTLAVAAVLTLPLAQAQTTQGAGLAYREEFNTLGEFFRKVGNLFRSKDNQREVE